MISIDPRARRIDLELPLETVRQRIAAWKPPAPRYRAGVFAKYAALVSSAADGAVTGLLK